ncbi:MAG: calcium/sodium antiporter [Planctomycetota bacterium]|nr:calcium/sodium antiporter [Planctomycetota bacterium]
MPALLALALVIAGLTLLITGADRLLHAAVSLARRWHLPQAVIGATLVAGGTSLPELAASVSGALGGQFGLAVGNVVGSNIANIGLILGLVALIAPLSVAPTIAWREWPLMLAVSALAAACAWGLGAYPRWLCALFLATWIAHAWRSMRQGAGSEEAPAQHPPSAAWRALLWAALGSALLGVGGWLLIVGSAQLARAAGISDAVIGLSIVAVGTSAPELVTSLLAAWRRQHQLAVANIVGSNTFNLLLILGVTGLFGTLPIAREILERDLWWMLGFALALPLAWGLTARRIARFAAAVLLAGYVLYLAQLAAEALLAA